MAEPTLHLIKLSVGTEDIPDLARWFSDMKRQEGRCYHRTRMYPKRAEELLQGGSIYWVIKGQILCRQRLIGFEEALDRKGRPGGTLLLMEQKIHPTVPMPHRAFQGWRYLEPAKAPPDLKGKGGKDDLPPALAAELRALGCW